jgi:hypothetical protein
VKPLAVVLAAVAVVFTAGCSSSNNAPSTPPPVTGGFTNADLNGTYAFSMSGTDAGANFGAFIARVGSFTADGSGHITAALEDVTDAGSLPQLVQFTGGSYSIQANGRGTLTLLSSTGGLQMSIALNSGNAGVMIQTDLNAASSGSFTRQTPAMFTQTAIAGPYAFDISGTTIPDPADPNALAAPSSVVGQINTSGAGNVQGGLFDSNDGGSLLSAQVIAAGGTYQMDPANGASFGRGTIDFAGLSFVFYIVDGSRFKLMEDDGKFATFGDALQQSATVATQNSGFTGDFTFLIGGATLGTTGTGPLAEAAAFTADGNGNLGGIVLDANNSGAHDAIGDLTTISNAIYDMDTANAGSGRGTMTFTASGNSNLGTFAFVFYLISPTQAFIQDTSNGIIGDGTMFAQTGPFSGASLAGNFVFNWSGINLGSSTNLTFQEDFVGRHSLSNTGAIAGAVDFVELGSSSQHSPAFLNQALTGTLTLSSSGGVGSNDYTVTTGTSPQTTFHFKAYIANPDLILLVGVDGNRTDAGSVSFQP